MTDKQIEEKNYTDTPYGRVYKSVGLRYCTKCKSKINGAVDFRKHYEKCVGEIAIPSINKEVKSPDRDNDESNKKVSTTKTTK